MTPPASQNKEDDVEALADLMDGILAENVGNLETYLGITIEREILMRVRTRAIPATDTEGAHIEATMGNKKLKMPWPYAESNPHQYVAETLAEAPLQYESEHATGYVYRELF